MKDENKEFYTEGCDTEVVDLQLEAFDELIDEIMLEALQHMTNTEKLDQAKYRRSAAGKKALLKHKKKIEKAGYRVDKKRSKLMQKVADFRKEDIDLEESLLEWDLDDEALVESLWEALEPEELAAFDELVEAVYAFAEAIMEDEEVVAALEETKKEEEIDPETGEEEDEEKIDEGIFNAVHRMSAAAKLAARKWRKSAAGKKSRKNYLRKLKARGGRVLDKARSKFMKLFGKRFHRESVDFDFVEKFGLNEEELLELLEAKEILEALFSEEELNLIESMTEACEDEDCEDCDDEDCEDEEDLEEGHLSAAEKIEGAKRRRTAEYKNWKKRYEKKRAKAGYKVNKAMSKAAIKAAKTRREAIEESLDSQFSATPLFESLNDAESNELKGIVFNAVTSILDQSYEKIAEDVTSNYEDYMSEEVMPEMCKLFEEYTAEIVKNLNENVEEYLDYVAAEILEDLEDKNLIVKSQKSEALEAFSEDLLSLIKDKLNIIPEQEDILLKNQETIKKLSEDIQEAKIETIRMREKLEESKRENYVLKNIPESLSDLQKENLQNYANDVLSEAEDFSEFKSFFDKAVNEAVSRNEEVKEEKKVVVEEKKVEKNFSNLAESLFRMGQI